MAEAASAEGCCPPKRPSLLQRVRDFLHPMPEKIHSSQIYSVLRHNLLSADSSGPSHDLVPPRPRKHSVPNPVAYSAAMICVGLIGKVYLAFNEVVVHDTSSLCEAQHRPLDQGLVTIMPHRAEGDDPLVIVAIHRFFDFFHPGRIRWGIGDRKLLFESKLAPFFRAGKVLPITRQGGVEQKDMLAPISKLDNGEWVNIFPEGYVKVQQNTLGMMTIRPGVSRLILDSKVPPVVVPLCHLGTGHMKPLYKRAAWGRRLDILSGAPIKVDDICKEYQNGRLSRTEAFTAISIRIKDGMNETEAELSRRKQAKLKRRGRLYPLEGEEKEPEETHGTPAKNAA